MKTWNLLLTSAISLILSCGTLANARSPLEPVKTDNPRDTMVTFMNAMNDYRLGVETDDSKLKKRILDAVRTLNLNELPVISRTELGKEAAILLKEVIDRVILIDPEKIPADSSLDRWRLKDTEIVISRVEAGPRIGEFQFSPDTVGRAREFFDKVSDLEFLEGSGQGALHATPWQKKVFPLWADRSNLGFRNWQLIGLLLCFGAGLALKLLAQGVLRLIKNYLPDNKESLRRLSIYALEKPLGLAVASGFWFFALVFLNFEGTPQIVLLTLIRIAFGFSIVWAAYHLLDVVELSLAKWVRQTNNDMDSHLVPLAASTLRVFTGVFGVLLVLQSLGFNVMSLLAGLGLGGLAFALAAKDTAANFLGSVMILIDQPFRIGDWIKAGEVDGNVEAIGFRSTRVRTFYNSVISIPNSTLATTNIDNMGSRDFRRVRTYLGVTYDTPPDRLEAFLEGIKNILKAHPDTVKDRINVAFDGFGDSSLSVLVNFFLATSTLPEELLIKQNIYFQILHLANELKVDFAFPTQTLHVETFPEKQPAINRASSNSAEDYKKVAMRFAQVGDLSKPDGRGIYTPAFKETNN